jgi:cytochrome P450
VWARQRRLANPAFRRAAVDTYADAMANAGAALLTGPWGRRGTRDVYADFNNLTLGIVADALFGADVKGAAAREINGAIAEAFEFFGKRSSAGMIIPEWVPIPDNLRYNAAVARLDKAVYSLIADRRRARAFGDAGSRDTGTGTGMGTGDVGTSGVSGGGLSGGPDLLDRLLDAKDDGEGGDGGGMDDRSLRDELMTLMVAGQETSAILLSWSCALLAQHPECADKCAAEASMVLGPDAMRNLPTAADYSKMPYLEAVVLETMRLLPPAYMVGRCCAEDVVVGLALFTHVILQTTLGRMVKNMN